MTIEQSSNPWYMPVGAWSKGSDKDVYHIATHCPYCGVRAKNPIRRYEGQWFRLRCRSCGHDYKVCGRG